MNCRPFAVIAVVFGGLVPAIHSVSADSPTHQRATATATILSGASTHDAAAVERVTSGQRLGKSLTVKAIYVDANGFITTVANPQRWRIVIIDMP